MKELWVKVREILKKNDGSLPEIEINVLTASEVITEYQYIRDLSEGFVSNENH